MVLAFPSPMALAKFYGVFSPEKLAILPAWESVKSFCGVLAMPRDLVWAFPIQSRVAICLPWALPMELAKATVPSFLSM
jgi:hypothetical protein